MKQEKIMALLKEAAHCSEDRRWKIVDQLRGEIYHVRKIPTGWAESLIGFHHTFTGATEAIGAIFNRVAEQTAENRPELLPSLFPIFAILCGDRPQNELYFVTNDRIDWSLLK